MSTAVLFVFGSYYVVGFEFDCGSFHLYLIRFFRFGRIGQGLWAYSENVGRVA